jgi:hypothetical protein
MVEETNEKVSTCRCHGDDRKGDYISMVCTEEDVAKTKEYILNEEINFINEQITVKQRRLKNLVNIHLNFEKLWSEFNPKVAYQQIVEII